MNSHSEYCFRLIGNIVDYDYFAEISKWTTESEILELLSFLPDAEAEGQSLHEYHLQRGYRGYFSNEKPGASLWKIDLNNINGSEHILLFYCDEIGPQLARSICGLVRGN